MFGEKTMYGNAIVKADHSNRIFLPPFTYAQENDEVIVMQHDDYLEIESEESINLLIDDINKLINETDDEKTVKLLRRKLDKLLMIIIKKCTVDFLGRISLPDVFVPDEYYQVVGAKDSIYVIKKDKNLIKE